MDWKVWGDFWLFLRIFEPDSDAKTRLRLSFEFSHSVQVHVSPEQAWRKATQCRLHPAGTAVSKVAYQVSQRRTTIGHGQHAAFGDRCESAPISDAQIEIVMSKHARLGATRNVETWPPRVTLDSCYLIASEKCICLAMLTRSDMAKHYLSAISSGPTTRGEAPVVQTCDIPIAPALLQQEGGSKKEWLVRHY